MIVVDTIFFVNERNWENPSTFVRLSEASSFSVKLKCLIELFELLCCLRWKKSVLLVSPVCFQKDKNCFFSFYINGNDRQGDRWGYGLGLECFYTS